MKKSKFALLTALVAVTTIVAYVLNIPEMVEGQGNVAPIVISVLFLIISAAYAILFKNKKAVRVIGTVYWSLSLIAALVLLVGVLSGSDSAVLIFPAFAFTSGYYSLAALLSPPSLAYLIVLAVIPAAQLVLRIVLMTGAKKAKADNK